MVKLTCIPKLAVMDEEVDINVIETKPNSAVTLSVSIAHFGILYLGYGHFYSDAHGHLNIKEHISYGGTYTGLQPMGLFASARAMPSKHSCPGIFVNGSVEQRLQYQINAWKGHLTQDQVHQLHVKYPSLGTSIPVNNFYDKLFLANSCLERTYLSSTVKRIPIKVIVDDEQICGVLFVPNGNGPFPGVIDVHGGPGGCPEFRAALIAKHGFVTLALAYFNYEGLKAKTYSEVDMSYFDKAISWLSKHPMVTPGGVSMVGFSLGAEVVVLSCIRNAMVRSAVCINSSLYMDTDASLDRPKPKDFTREIHEIRNGMICRKIEGKIQIPRPLLNYQHDNPMLFIIGEHDLFGPVVDDTIDQLKRSGKINIFRTVIEGQGHMIVPPYTPLCTVLPTTFRKVNTKSKDPYESIVQTVQHEWGGNYAKHGKGQLEAWIIMFNFLKKYSCDVSSKL